MTKAKPKIETPIEQTPEFHTAVSAAVAAAIPALKQQILANITAARADAPAAPGSSSDQAFAEGLAMALAQLTDQGTGRRRVAPEVIRARSEARERMTKLLVKAHAAGAIPSYRLKAKCYLDEVLIDPVWIGADHMQHPTEIDWPGVPNSAMVPINDTATEIHKAYLESVGSVPKEDEVPDGEFRVTAGGLVVRGRPVPQRAQTGLRNGAPTAGDQGLRIKHKEQAPGKFKEVRVLGTVAQPARESV